MYRCSVEIELRYLTELIAVWAMIIFISAIGKSLLTPEPKTPALE